MILPMVKKLSDFHGSQALATVFIKATTDLHSKRDHYSSYPYKRFKNQLGPVLKMCSIYISLSDQIIVHFAVLVARTNGPPYAEK